MSILDGDINQAIEMSLMSTENSVLAFGFVL